MSTANQPVMVCALRVACRITSDLSEAVATAEVRDLIVDFAHASWKVPATKKEASFSASRRDQIVDRFDYERSVFSRFGKNRSTDFSVESPRFHFRALASFLFEKHARYEKYPLLRQTFSYMIYFPMEDVPQRTRNTYLHGSWPSTRRQFSR